MQVTDPICGMTIENEKAAAREVWKGQTYYFCSQPCRKRFLAEPERYAKKANDRGPSDVSHGQ